MLLWRASTGRVYEPKIAFAAELDGELRGFIAGTIREEERSHSIVSQPYDIDASKSDNNVGWIEIMGVHVDHWGKGIGMALLNAFIDECKRQNASVRIVTRDDDENLKSFLNALKFKRDETVIYEKSL
jgi:GNAT superfamily N-acetyltransferase